MILFFISLRSLRLCENRPSCVYYLKISRQAAKLAKISNPLGLCVLRVLRVARVKPTALRKSYSFILTFFALLSFPTRSSAVTT